MSGEKKARIDDKKECIIDRLSDSLVCCIIKFFGCTHRAKMERTCQRFKRLVFSAASWAGINLRVGVNTSMATYRNQLQSKRCPPKAGGVKFKRTDGPADVYWALEFWRESLQCVHFENNILLGNRTNARGRVLVAQLTSLERLHIPTGWLDPIAIQAQRNLRRLVVHTGVCDLQRHPSIRRLSFEVGNVQDPFDFPVLTNLTLGTKSNHYDRAKLLQPQLLPKLTNLRVTFPCVRPWPIWHQLQRLDVTIGSMGEDVDPIDYNLTQAVPGSSLPNLTRLTIRLSLAMSVGGIVDYWNKPATTWLGEFASLRVLRMRSRFDLSDERRKEFVELMRTGFPGADIHLEVPKHIPSLPGKPRVYIY
jgi:hypothetical protein